MKVGIHGEALNLELFTSQSHRCITVDRPDDDQYYCSCRSVCVLAFVCMYVCLSVGALKT